MKNPKFSFIVPIYNTDVKLLDFCLKSILKQSYKNFEIILVNDNSTNENTNHYISSIAKKNIKTITNYENIGLGPSRNVGIENSSGDVILFVDSDDWISKDTLMFLSKIDFNKFDIASFNFSKVSCNDNKIVKNIDYIAKINDIEIYGGGIAWSKAYSKKFIDANNLRFHDSKLYHEDEYFTMLCLRYEPSICSLNECLYFYRTDVSTSICNTETIEKKFSDISILMSEINLDKKDNFILKKWYSTYNSTLIFLYLKYPKASLKNFLKYSKAWIKNKKCIVFSRKYSILYKIIFTYPMLLLVFIFRKIVIRKL